ncbi:MAG TPA: DinB family protein [Lacibacter sp.]|nr:DinB family protein [Lacibacter sp.]HMO87576.1 DinB family protein [Lacibacter sp.]HMP87127.1 DinB family protein [Lacibacter sp.]
MNRLMADLAAYNHWANETLTHVILQLGESLQQQIVTGSFPNLYATVLHSWDAESGWWQRMEGHRQLVIPSRQFNPTMKETVNGLLHQSLLWKNWAAEVTAEQLCTPLPPNEAGGDRFPASKGDVLVHVCNHSTYHRGQLVHMLRQLGMTDIPQTDYIHWCRSVRNG